jgi:hypothetical protein
VRRAFWGSAFLLLALIAPSAGAAPSATINATFRTYANNVRVRPPLVGRWQLGTARLHGSVTLTSTSIDGTFSVVNDPLYSRYAPHSIRAKAIGYQFYQAAHDAYTKLTLNVEVTASSTATGDCAIGARGILTLYESAQKLSNGERSDYVTLHWPRAAHCLAHEQGWTNEDGGARTSPTYGGPPHGGQWAIVRIS